MYLAYNERIILKMQDVHKGYGRGQGWVKKYNALSI
jgi:hypothetical protein